MEQGNKFSLSEEALKARRAYQNRYRKANPDKVRAWHASYWRRKAEKAAAAPIKAEEEKAED